MQPDSNDSPAARDRAAERRNFFLSTNVLSPQHGTHTARVRNLSAGGMMIEFEAVTELAPGEIITAELRNIGRVKGEVAWTKGRRIGVRFEREIDPEQARKPVAGGPGTPDYVKPVLVPGRSLKYVQGL